MRDALENAYDAASGHCLEAMQHLRHFSGTEAIDCLKAAIRSVERGQRQHREEAGREARRHYNVDPVAAPPPADLYGDRR